MQRPGSNAHLAKRRNLIVHQGNQRRDHHRRAGAAKGRDLIANALAAAGRHQHQGIAAGNHVPDGILLQAPEGREAENPT